MLSLLPIIPIRQHAVLDYGSAAGLIGLPSVLDFGPAAGFSHTLGAMTLGVSLLTKYPTSVIKLIPIEYHALADYGVAGLLLVAALSSNRAVKPALWSHVLIGLTGLVGSLLTDYREERRCLPERLPAYAR